MKLVVATPLYPPELGEPAAYVQELASQLAPIHDVVVVAYATTFEPKAVVPLVTVTKQYPLIIRMVIYAARLLGSSKRADAIYVQRALASGVPAIVVGWLRRVPVVVNFVSDEVGNSSQWRKQLQGFVLRRAAQILAPSSYLAKQCAEVYGVAPEKVSICPLPLPPDEILPFKPQRQSRLILAHAPANGAIQAMPELLDSFSDVRLVVVGEAANESSSIPGVSFLGRVSKAEEWYKYRQASIYIMDSQDGRGEARALAASWAGAAVVDAASENLAKDIGHMLRDSAAREAAAAAGKADAEKRASWHSHLAALESSLRV